MADWTEQEVEIPVQDYFSMFRADLQGKPYSKSDHRKRLSPFRRFSHPYAALPLAPFSALFTIPPTIVNTSSRLWHIGRAADRKQVKEGQIAECLRHPLPT